jgi:HPt (histidine-containing phosphotransfer) domain-containing protein
MPEIPESAKPALDMLRGVGGDEMVAMLLKTFIQFADERVAKLGEESGAARWSEVASIAHAIKSSARQLGAMELADACASVETTGRANDAAASMTGVAAIQREYATARAWMAAAAG